MSSSNLVLVAHRGFSSKAPENTMAALKLAFDSGFPHLEFDVQLTNDGVPVIIHDTTVNRTTDGTGKVRKLNLAEIKKLDAGSWFDSKYAGEPVPTLAELLKEFSDKAFLDIELKSDEPELPARVFEELKKTNLLKVAGGADYTLPGLNIISFSADQLKRSIELMPEVKHAYLVNRLDSRAITKAKNMNVRTINAQKGVDQMSVRRAASEGLAVRCWCPKRPENVVELREAGVQAATVDWPDQAAKYLSV